MNLGLEKIETQIEEDYTKILPVFKESMPETETLVMGDMERSIDKATKLIKIHSITNPPEKQRRQQNPRKRKPIKPEYNKIVDDAYIMMGRAYLYQKNYFLASNTFSLVIRRFKDEPAKYDAYIWLIRTYNESERFTEAKELIDMLETDEQFPEKLEGELAIVTADMYLKQLEYDQAIPYLNIGAKKIKGNKRKTRYNFILGQLYQEQGNSEKALEAYQRVIRRRPDYEMLFNARINSAGAFSGEGDVATLRRELNRMVKKRRNTPYLDQIYYALGSILYNEGRINDAVDYYKMSAAASVTNTHQRALSCITLAEIYFDKRDYIPSGMYYDSAMVLIDDNYPNFTDIERKHTSLSSLVGYLLEVEKQDSLQHLAGLSKEELDLKINGWIEAEKMRFEEMEAEMASDEYGGAYSRGMGRTRQRTQGSGWYFYNPSTIAYGKQEFKRLWGDRKNEDNWRRKDKSISLLDETGEPIAEDFEELLEEEEELRADDPTTKEYYLQDIPVNDSLMAISHDKIRDALFEAGMIFKNDFNDFENSIETFNELNRRYPKNTYELPSFFYLWDLYSTVEKPDSAGLYKSSILNKYPESNYAKYLLNPNYFIEEEARKDSMNTVYNLAFNSYRNRDFARARNYSRMVLSMDPDLDLLSKARFIEMVSTSRNLNQSRFADSLKNYIEIFPQAETTPLAKQIFELIKEEKLDDFDELINTGYLSDAIKNIELIAQNQDQGNQTSSKWDTGDDLLHYFIIAFPNVDEIDINRLRFDIANYNIDHYTTLDFDIESEALNSETRMIVVRNFSNKDAALIYFHSIIRKPEVFKTLAGHKFLNFVTSSSNYREMTNDRSYDEYLSYFVKNYSIHTSGDFPEDELDSPEELMARLSRDPNEELIEKGEFVLIETDTLNYEAPEPKEQIFKPGYDTPHSYIIMIDEPRFSTGFIMRDFVRYNTTSHRDKRLRVVPANMTEKTLLLVSQFDNAYEAMQYMNTVKNQDNLYSSLGDTEYEHFIISTENLQQLTGTNNLEEWSRFYRMNYIQRRPQAPRDEAPLTQETTDAEQETEMKVEPGAELPATQNAAEQSPIESQAETTKTEESEPGTEKLERQIEDTLTSAPSTVVTAETYNGPYTFNAEENHKLIFILPSSGSNQTLLTTYLTRLNATTYRGQNIEVNTDTFDDFRSLVVISGIGNLEKAAEYMTNVKSDSRITMSLRNVNYRSYLITTENLGLFKAQNDIQGYEKFYNIFY
jgi:tetratricopeptide (TPR) repeat protein